MKCSYWCKSIPTKTPAVGVSLKLGAVYDLRKSFTGRTMPELGKTCIQIHELIFSVRTDTQKSA